MAQLPGKSRLTGNVTTGEYKQALNQFYDVVETLFNVDPEILINKKITESERKTNDTIERNKVTRVSQLTNDKKYLMPSDIANKQVIKDSAVPQVIYDAVNGVYAKKTELPTRLSQLSDDRNQLGIVAGSLQENGWVKFANGLILQWGIISGGTYQKAFPISFSRSCFHVNGMWLAPGNFNSPVTAKTYTKTEWKWGSRSSFSSEDKMLYVALGI